MKIILVMTNYANKYASTIYQSLSEPPPIGHHRKYPPHHPASQESIDLIASNKIFMFLINPPSGNAKIQKLIAKHIFECFVKWKGEDGKK